EHGQGGGQVAAEGGEAHAAALGRHMANLARGLETMVVGRAPPFALVVEDAAGVEAEIAAEGAHIALGWPGHRCRGFGYRGVVLRHPGMAFNLLQRDSGSKAKTV